ncbi:MAG: hypothetical protein QOJ64_1254 [Acidobacteriota bacterium]|jgi:hypothetical protein|nr:hypothetical protein [Acidobacteriota bacterium]
MKKSKRLSSLLSMVFAIAFLNVLVSAQSADDKNRIASAASNGDSVRFDVAVQHSGATLTVSAPNGKVYRKEFKAGTAPIFKLVDKLGARLPDGQYVYELRLTPTLSPEMKKELAASRDKDEDAAEEAEGRARAALPSNALVQSGAFSVQGGAIVVAGGIEAEAPRGGAKVGSKLRSLQEPDPYDRRGASSLQGAAYFLDAVVRQPTRKTFVAGIPHPAFPDDVIPDDLIVQGSACVGLDCVNGETFGFDTIRLKENNTRIQFDDTSVGSFPTNNWQIRANSSASGGESFLGFVDQGASGNSETGTVVLSVAAGAAANSIKVDSTGRLGLRTATPVLDVHINTSNTPAIRLEQNSSGGFTAQTWDVAGNEANFFVRDVTGGSRFPFRIRPGAPTSSIDISASGNVGIATASPHSALDVSGNTLTLGSVSGGSNRLDATIKLNRFAMPPFTNANLDFALFAAATTSTENIASFGGGATGFSAATVILFNTGATTNTDTGTERMRITSAGNVGIGTNAPTDLLSVNGNASKPGGGSWSSFSDERLKNITGRFNSGLSAVMQLQPLRYEYKRNNALGLVSNGEHIGFGAQAVQKLIPEAVTTTAQGYLLVNNDPILWTMLNAIKEQQKEIEQLKVEVRRLRMTSRRRGH